MILCTAMADSSTVHNLFHSYNFPLRMLKVKIFGPPPFLEAIRGSWPGASSTRVEPVELPSLPSLKANTMPVAVKTMRPQAEERKPPPGWHRRRAVKARGL